MRRADSKRWRDRRTGIDNDESASTPRRATGTTGGDSWGSTHGPVIVQHLAVARRLFAAGAFVGYSIAIYRRHGPAGILIVIALAVPVYFFAKWSASRHPDGPWNPELHLPRSKAGRFIALAITVIAAIALVVSVTPL